MRYPFWLNDNVDIDISRPNIHTSTFTLHKIYSLNTLFVFSGVKYNCVSYVHLDIRFVFCFCIIIGYKDIRSCKQFSFPQPPFLPPAKYLKICFSMLKSDIRSCKQITHPPILHIASQGLACLSSNYWILGLVHMFLIPYPFPHPFFI